VNAEMLPKATWRCGWPSLAAWGVADSRTSDYDSDECSWRTSLDGLPDAVKARPSH